jgi:tagaturonate epimerase
MPNGISVCKFSRYTLEGADILMKDKIIAAVRDVEKSKTEIQGVYTSSVRKISGGLVFAYRDIEEDYLIVAGSLASELKGYRFEIEGKPCTAAPFGHESAEFLRKHFPFTAPVAVLKHDRTIGLGDRLGIATPGHIDAVSDYDAYPVFAQQSIRELNLTGRTYEEVLDDATFAVYCAGFERGFGADGDHLKTAEEVKYALASGYTMITLDCSEHINNDVAGMSDEQVSAACCLPDKIYNRYIGKKFEISPCTSISIDEMTLKKAFMIYGDAIEFAEKIFAEFISANAMDIDFEISIDETATPTLPQHHFFVANELSHRHVSIATIAPRFCGEFQKGIDYIGDIARFEEELKVHAAIANHFSYKLSIHSGSDKFSIFRMIGQHTCGRFHLKTAGTNWLEAMRLVAMKDARLYREIHHYAIIKFSEAAKLYKVTTDLANIPEVDSLSDEQLPALFSNNDARQLIHITYGYILTAKSGDGSALFSEALYRLWRQYVSEYRSLLKEHIGKHLALLFSGFDCNDTERGKQGAQAEIH